MRHRITAAARTVFLTKAFNTFDRVSTRAPPDPFGIADPCPYSATGIHEPIPSVGDVVCFNCSKVLSL